jgi:hypothetical protein
MRTGQSKLNFSDMTHKQIEIGMTVADLAKEEIAEGVAPMMALERLIRQCLDRDEHWKDFYTQEMDTLNVKATSPALLDMFSAELDAEKQYQEGALDKAIEIIQELIDKHVTLDNKEDRGWYLQEMARYKHSVSATEANAIQVKAHKMNRSLMRPKSGMVIEELIVSQKRVENIRAWIHNFESNEALMLSVSEIASSLVFGKHADEFEAALQKMGVALGFNCQRPDKEWREGPDNLWGIREGHFLLFECKSEVEQSRTEIYKTESGQMNNSCAWFKQHYKGALAKNILVIPTKQLGPGAGFNDPVQVMRRARLKDLVRHFTQFFQEFKQLDLKDISDSRIQQAISEHHLAIDDLLNKYSEDPLPI